MALIGEQIRKQMELTAALMSDPMILASEPSVVASSFAATLKKIDMLQAYLRPKDGSPAPRCDASIINDGVKQMVYLAMDKQMQPLKEPLPSVVDTELRKAYDAQYDEAAATHHPNLADREIKETNCMAAMVLANYYVQWHVLLMQINQLEAPFRDENMDKDIEALQNLPKMEDLLEFRPFKGHFDDVNDKAGMDTAWTNLVKHKAAINMMVNPGLAHMKGGLSMVRTSSAVILYQYVLSGRNGIKNDIQTLITTILNAIHHTTATLTGGVLTTLQLQDETQIWKDMQTLTNVISMDFNSNQTRYSYVLQNIVSHPPYFETPNTFIENGTPLCIYNFNATAFMTDICMSLYHLRRLNQTLHDSAPNPAEMSGALTGRFFNAFGRTKAETAEFATALRNNKNARPPPNEFEFFISETANHARVRNGCLQYQKGFTVDDVAGMYISKGNLTHMERSNHVYLAHPSVINVPPSQAGFVTRLQNMINLKPIQADSFDHVAFSTRNSLFTIYALRSALALVDRVKDHPVFRASLGRYNGGSAVIDRATLVQLFANEQKAFKEVWERMAKSGQGRYPKYAGISWPVKYMERQAGDMGVYQQKDNTKEFNTEGYIPRMIKGTQYELVKGVVDIADGVNMAKIALAAKAETRPLVHAYNLNGIPMDEIAASFGSMDMSAADTLNAASAFTGTRV